MNYVTFWDDPEVDYRKLVEQELFKIIKREISNKFTKNVVCSVGDSFAIRAYLPFKRDFNDIDLIFPHDYTPKNILDLAGNCEENPKIINARQDGKFVRVVYYLPNLDKIGNDFRIDFHLGGIFYHDNCYTVTENYFQNTEWKSVFSFGDLSSVLLPIPKIEDLFVLKIIKFIGSDKIDIFSMLLYDPLNFDYIREQLEVRNENDLARKNLANLNDNFKYLLNEWSYKYFGDLDGKGIAVIEDRMKKILP
jgi:hypothetical protein